MNRGTFSPRRAGLIAGNTFRDAVRQRLLVIVLLVAAATVGGALFLRELSFGSSELKFLTDVGMGALAFFGAMLAIVAPAQLFFSDLERRTVLTVLAKPVTRAEFMVGKLGGVLLLLAVFCAAMTALLAGLLVGCRSGMIVAHPDGAGVGLLATLGGVALCGLVAWLKLGVVAALTLCVASYARSSVFAMMAGLVTLVACELQYLARDFYGMMASAWARAAVWLLGLMLPDFEPFNVSGRVAAGEGLPVGLIGGLAVYALAYMAVFGGLAVYCFRHREL
ncbi:MAG TPA: ABC transporter permease subunit [Opitutaceae bacterium]|nr:ABC transporter permease subunit [Opitutaceae bacterium]